MQKFFKGWLYFSSRLALLSGMVLTLLLSSVMITYAAPLIDDPTKIVVFFAYDNVYGGSSGNQQFDSFNGTSCGVGIPTNFGNIGIKTTTDTSKGYYEIFTTMTYNEDIVMDLSLNNMGDNGTILRYCAYRPLAIELSDFQKINAVFGPGVAILSTRRATTFSILIQAKANYYFMEGCFAYGNVMYDFMYNTGNIELGVGFSY